MQGDTGIKWNDTMWHCNPNCLNVDSNVGQNKASKCVNVFILTCDSSVSCPIAFSCLTVEQIEWPCCQKLLQFHRFFLNCDVNNVFATFLCIKQMENKTKLYVIYTDYSILTTLKQKSKIHRDFRCRGQISLSWSQALVQFHAGYTI